MYRANKLYVIVLLWSAEGRVQGEQTLCYCIVVVCRGEGTAKTEQGGGNQARHVVLTLESGISLLVALFPVKKSQKSQKSHSSGTV